MYVNFVQENEVVITGDPAPCNDDDDEVVEIVVDEDFARLAGRCGRLHHGELGTVVVVVDDGSRMLMELINQGRLEVADVVDHIVDDFHLGDFAILRHVGHQFSQFAQIHLDLHLFVIRLLFADFPVQNGRRCR